MLNTDFTASVIAERQSRAEPNPPSHRLESAAGVPVRQQTETHDMCCGLAVWLTETMWSRKPGPRGCGTKTDRQMSQASHERIKKISMVTGNMSETETRI